jgi:DNA repair exonuclease SbcCD nuclease subunit
VTWTAGQLRRLGRPVVVLPGNHDHIGPGSIYRNHDITARGSSVMLLDNPRGRLIKLPDISIWGRGVEDHDPSFRPLQGLPPRPATGWCIALAHGLVVDSDQPSTRGSPIYPRDLASVGWDYVALGHWPMFRVIPECPVPAVYAGPTARSHLGEPGAVVVDISASRGAVAEWRRLDG